MYICVSHVCLVTKEAKRGPWIPWKWSYRQLWLSLWCWEPSSGPQQEQWVLLTSSILSSPHPLFLELVISLEWILFKLLLLILDVLGEVLVNWVGFRSSYSPCLLTVFPKSCLCLSQCHLAWKGETQLRAIGCSSLRSSAQKPPLRWSQDEPIGSRTGVYQEDIAT